MTSARTTIAALLTSISLAAGCGGAGAALQVQPYPGDLDATPRRLESLAREFENTFGCTEEDIITIRGIAPHVYSAQGCNAARDYVLGCRPGPYGQICSWQALADLAYQASLDLRCEPDYIDVQTAGPMQRTADGCGSRATYMLQCAAGTCAWMLMGPIQQSDPAAGGAYTY